MTHSEVYHTMHYESLHHIYYKQNPKWETVYNQRLNSPAAKILPLSIKQYGRSHANPAFYCYTEEIALLQDQIMAAFHNFVNIAAKLPDFAMPQYLRASLIEEIQSTNDIEGVRSTRREIMTALNASAPARTNYRLGSLVDKYEKAMQGERLTLNCSQDIRQLFDELMWDEISRDNPHNLPDGQIFRKSSVDVVSASQKTVHRGIYPEAEIIQHMDNALQVLNDSTIPIFIRVAVFHYFFGYIHPFYDGNGRLARFITAYFLAQKLHPAISLQLSVLLKAQRSKYYKLFTITDADINRGDLTPFIIGMLEFIEEAIIHTTNCLQEKYSQYKDATQKISLLNLSNKTTRSLCDLLLQASIFAPYGITMSELTNALHKSENTVYTHLKKLPADLLIVDRQEKTHYYRLNFNLSEAV